MGALSDIGIAEAAFDITQEIDFFMFNLDLAGIDRGDIDSRELFHKIMKWATDFEKDFAPGMDYLPVVTGYAWKKIEEMFPKQYAAYKETHTRLKEIENVRRKENGKNRVV